MAWGIGPSVSLSMLLDDNDGDDGDGSTSSSIVECINLHSNELQTLLVVDDRTKDEADSSRRADRRGKRSRKVAGKIAGDSTFTETSFFNSLVELDVSSNNLGVVMICEVTMVLLVVVVVVIPAQVCCRWHPT